jgi:tetratricopeptide (TPR) repeat protein
MRRWIYLSAVVAALAATGTQAHAGDRETCVSSSDDQGIAACTALIASDKFKGKLLARVHFNRGVAWSTKGDHDRSIADYSEAIRIDPREAMFYFNRCDEWIGKGNHERAIADCNEAIKLDAKICGSFSQSSCAPS